MYKRQLLALSLSGRLDRREVAAELERQVDRFEAAMGRPPDFLDGHHHVHQLPGVRGAVLDLARRRLPPHGWVRVCGDSPWAVLGRRVDVARTLLIGALGLGFARRLDRAGIARNRAFRGVYDFSGRVGYDRLFARFVAQAGPGTLMMCHPGFVDDALRAVEHLTDQREVEYRFLASADCPATLAAHGLTLSPLPRR